MRYRKSNKMDWHCITKKLTAVLLVLTMVLSLAGCQLPWNNDAEQTTQSEQLTPPAQSYANEDLDEFNSFTDDFFRANIVQNTLNMHSFVKDPSKYGIDSYDVSLGSFKVEDLDSTSEYVDCLNELKGFDRSQLSQSQQLTYDEMKEYLETELEYSDLYTFWGQLTPTSGVQTSLPMLFSEYSFDKKQDIDDYIALISQTDRYYQELIDFEKLRSEQGYFMEDTIADKVIDQCQTFIDTMKTDNYLVTTFNSRIDAFSGLTSEEVSTYKAANEAAVKEHVIPAYQILVEGLKGLKGTNKYQGGLANYPNGKKYYEYLLDSELGWNKSVEELDGLLDEYLQKELLSMSILVKKDSTLLDGTSDFSFVLTDPNQILTDLSEKLKTDFPDPPQVDYEVKYIDKSLEEYSNPAMYIIPQIDNYTDNVIYINGSNKDTSTLYATLAHEGYPGHMYQSTYFASTNPSAIRYLIRPSGYLEGWASYVEAYSYDLEDSQNKNLNTVMKDNYLATLMLYSKVDIGVNYYGWTVDDTSKFLSQYGFSDASIAKQMYEAMEAEPGVYPKYSLGCVAMMELRNTAESALGSNFSAKEFHRFLMETGPAQFDIIEDRLQEWIDAQ